jgi:hypothetical protein
MRRFTVVVEGNRQAVKEQLILEGRMYSVVMRQSVCACSRPAACLSHQQNVKNTVELATLSGTGDGCGSDEGGARHRRGGAHNRTATANGTSLLCTSSGIQAAEAGNVGRHKR